MSNSFAAKGAGVTRTFQRYDLRQIDILQRVPEVEVRLQAHPEPASSPPLRQAQRYPPSRRACLYQRVHPLKRHAHAAAPLGDAERLQEFSAASRRGDCAFVQTIARHEVTLTTTDGFWRFLVETGSRHLGRQGAAVSSHRDSVDQEWSAEEARKTDFRWRVPRRPDGADRHSGYSRRVPDRALVDFAWWGFPHHSGCSNAWRPTPRFYLSSSTARPFSRRPVRWSG